MYNISYYTNVPVTAKFFHERQSMEKRGKCDESMIIYGKQEGLLITNKRRG